jgi:hypothetical protein
MVCEFYHRELGPLEPIYRLPLGRVAGQGIRASLCKGCLDKSVFVWLDEIPLFREQNCEHCGRPIFHSKPLEIEPANLFSQMPQRTYTARAKERRTLRRPERKWPRCHRTFTPKRIDARYCSPACKQAAYRLRIGLVTI